MIPSRRTLVKDVIQGFNDDTAPALTVEHLASFAGRSKHTAAYGKLLLACEGDQMRFLCHLWDGFVPDHVVQLTWISLLKAGFFIECLDVKSTKARDLMQAVQFAIAQTQIKERAENGTSPRRNRHR